MTIEELQKALDKRPEPKLLSEFPLNKGYDNQEVMDWFMNFVALFSSFKGDYEKLQKDLACYRERDRVLEQNFVVVPRKQLKDEKAEALKNVGWWRQRKKEDNSPPFDNAQTIARAKVCWIEKLLEDSGKKVDVVEEMDKFERNESLAEGETEK